MSRPTTTNEEKIQAAFLEWCVKNGLALSSKVKVSCEGCCHRFGMVATSHIAAGETLFKVPRKLLLNAETSAVGKLIEDYDANNGSDIMEGSPSGWVPVILALMHECSLGEGSQWAPYLRIIPPIGQMNHPCLWPANTIDALLEGVPLKEDVLADVEDMAEEFNSYAKPFIASHPERFTAEFSTLESYTRLACFVMAYSFTEEDTGVSMVPMADILNHHSDNNAQLEFGKKSLSMVSTKDINLGDEIFNTFGEVDNSKLLQMYGYIEKDNPYDCVTIRLADIIAHGGSEMPAAATDLARIKWDYLQKKVGMTAEDSIQMSQSRVLDASVALETLQCLHLDCQGFIALLTEQEKHRTYYNQLKQRVLDTRSKNESVTQASKAGRKRQGEEDLGKQQAKAGKLLPAAEGEIPEPMTADEHAMNCDDGDTSESNSEELSDDEDESEAAMETNAFMMLLPSSTRQSLACTIRSKLVTLNVCPPKDGNDVRHTLAAELRTSHLRIYEHILKILEEIQNPLS